MDSGPPIVAHPTFTREVLRFSVPRRTEIYIALRAIERGDEHLERDEGNIYHLDLPLTPQRRLRLLLARGVKDHQDMALATDAFWVEEGAATPASRIEAARHDWDSWSP